MNEFGYIIDALISLNVRNRGLVPKGKLPPLQQLLDHETVHVNIGRATGKTEYILSRIKESDLLIVPNQYSAKMYSEKLGFNEKIKIVYKNEDLDFSNIGRFKVMYIDEPRLCFRNIRKEILYDYFYNGSIESQLVLMLGE